METRKVKQNKMRGFISVFLLAMILFSVNDAFADQISWDGGGGDSLWTNTLNWSNDLLPTNTDTVTIDAGVAVILDSIGQCAALTIGGSVGGDTLIVMSGNQLTIDEGSAGTYGPLTIASDGIFELDGTAILYLVSNWTNAGDFIENNSTVVFIGGAQPRVDNNATDQQEVFYNLTNNKSTAGRWQNTTDTKILVKGNLSVAGTRQFRIVAASGGIAAADLRVEGDLTISNTSAGFYYGTGTVVELAGDLINNETGAGGIQVQLTSELIFNGTGDQSYTSASTVDEIINDLTVDKSSGTFTLNDGLRVREDLTIINGDVAVASNAILQVGETVNTTTGDSLIIQSGNTFTLEGSSSLEMLESTVIQVESGGTFEALGTSDSDMATVTRQGATGNFVFNVAGKMRAKYTNFSYMNTSGVNLATGSTLDDTDNFDFSVFSNGASGGRYLTVANLSGGPQAFEIDSVEFSDVIAGGNNVFKTLGDDTLKFYGATGSFAGENFDGGSGDSQVLWFGTLNSITWTGTLLDGDWSAADNWNPIIAPSENVTAIIPVVANPYPTISGNSSVKDLNIQSGASVTVSTGITLDVKENMTNAGTLTLSGTSILEVGGNFDNTSGTLNANSSTVLLDSTLAQSFTTGGAGSGKQFYNLTVNKPSGTVTLSDSLDINNNFTLTSGTFDAGASANAISVANNWSNAGTFTHQNTRVTFDGTGTITSGGAGAGKSFYDLIFTGTTHTLNGDIQADNDVEIQTGATLDAGVGNSGILLAGDWTNDGTFTPQLGTVTFNGTADQNLDLEPNIFYDLTVNKASGNLVNSAAGLINISNDLTVTSGTFLMSGDTLDIGGDVSIGSGGTLNIAGDSVYVGGGWSNSGSLLAAAGSLIKFDAASGSHSIGDQTTGEIDYIEFGGAGTYTLVTSLDVDEDLTISGTATLVLNEQTIYIAGSWYNSATFNAGSAGTVVFDGAAGDSIRSGGSSFYNLTVDQTNAGSDIFVVDDLDLNGSLNILSGDFIDTLSTTMNIGGDFIIGADGRRIPGTGLVTMDAPSGGPYTIDDGNNLNQIIDLTIDAGSNVTYNLENNSDSESDIDGDLRIVSGMFDMNGQTLNFGTVEAVDFDSLIVNGTFTIGPGAILKMDSPQALDTGNDIVVRSGGTLKVVGESGNEAEITRIGEGGSAVRKWRLTVQSGGTIEARYALFNHVDGTNGINLQDGAILHPVNNFSYCQFDATSTNSRYLKIGNLSGSGNYDIYEAGFLNIPTGTSYNVDKTDESSDSLFFYNAYGVFAGEDYDNDTDALPIDSGQVVWRNTTPAREWTGTTSSAWEVATNWVGNQVPGADEDVLIPNVLNDPVVSGTDSCRNVSFTNLGNITIQGGGELYVTGNLNYGTSGNDGDITILDGGTLYIAGNYDKQYGSLDAQTNSTVVLNGSADQNFHTGGNGDGDDFYNLTINKSGGTVLVENTVEVNGTFTLQSGSFDLSNGLGWNIEIEEAYVNSGGTLIPGNQTVNFNGTAGTINGGVGSGKTFYRVLLSTGTYTLTGNLDVSFELQINAGATLDAGANYDIYLARLLDNDGTFIPRNGGLILDRTESVTLDVTSATGTVSFYNLTINKLTDAIIDVNGYVDVNGDFNVTSGRFDFDGTDTLDVEGNVVISSNGNLSRGGGATGMYVAGDWLNTGTFDNTSGGPVYFDGTDQTITGGFHDLVLANSGTKTAGEALDINRNITIDTGVTFNGAGYNHTIYHHWTNDGSYIPGSGGTITFNGLVDQTITTGGSGAGKEFENLVINNTGSDANNDLTIVGDIKVTGDFTLTDGDFHTETNNIDVIVAGNWNVSTTGRFYPGTGMVTFNGTGGGPYMIDGGTPAATANIFNNITVNAPSVTYQLTKDLEINDDLLISAGTLDLNGQVLQFGDANTDSIKIAGGTLDIDNNATVQMYAATGAGADLVVQNGGTIVVVGSAGSDATVTRFSGTGATDRYSFKVESGATIQARYALFEYMDTDGIQLETGSTLHPINNLSNVNFNNGPSGGRYLSIDDISGANQNITINSASFLSNPGGGAYNVDKSVSSDSLIFNQATGVFAGASFENDPGGVVSWASPVSTRNWTGLTGVDWSTSSNWEGNQVPTVSEDVNIPGSATNMPTVSGTQVAQSITLESGATLTISAGDTLDLGGSANISAGATVTMQDMAVLTIAGDFVNAGTIVENTSKIVLDGNGDQSINAQGQGGTKELYDLVIDKSGGTATLASTIEINGSLEIVNGTLDVSGSNYAMLIAGNWSNTGSFTPREGTVTLEQSGGTLVTGGNGSGKRFYNLIVSGTASKVLAGDLAVTNNLTIALGGALDVSTSNYSLNVSGNWDNDGIFTARNGTVTFDGTGDQSLEVLATVGSFYNFSINKSAGTATVTSTPLDINGSFTITSGTLDFGVNAIDVEGTTNISGTITGSGTITAASDWNNTDGVLTGLNSLTLDGAAQTFSGDFNNIILSGSSTKTAGGVVDIAGDVTINSGVTFDGASYTHTISGDWNNTSGNFTANTSTIVFDGAAVTQTLNTGGIGSTKAFNNFSINKSSGSVSLPVSNDLDINGNVVISAGTMTFDGNTVYIGGSWSNAGTVEWTAGTGEVLFDAPSGSYTIDDGGSPFALVTINTPAATYQLNDQTRINGNLDIASGTLDLNGKILEFGDAANDTLKVTGILAIDEAASLRMFTASDTGAALIAESGGTVQVVGTSGNPATVSRYNGTESGDRYTFTVQSGATIESRYAKFTYMNKDGIRLEDDATLNATNNFSDTEFSEGEAGGRYLYIGNITGTDQFFTLNNVGFTTSLGVSGFNIDKSSSADTLKLENAYGIYAGAAYENDPAGDPGGLIQWSGTQTAIVWTGSVDRDWTDSGNWQGAAVPTSTDDVTIPNVTNDPIVSGTQVAKSVTIQSGGLLTISAGDTLDLSGGFTNSGILLMQNNAVLSIANNYSNAGTITPNASKIVFDGSADQSISSGGTSPDKSFNNIEINKSSGNLTLAGAINVDNDLIITQGTLDVTTNNYQINLGGDWLNNGSFNARLGTTVLDGSATLTTNGTGSGKSFYNLKLLGSASATATLAGDLDINNDLMIETGASLNAGAGNHAILIAGDWDNDGTFTAQGGTVTFDGSGDQSIDASATVSSFNNLTVNKSAGTVTVAEGPLDINGALTVSSGALSTQNIAVDIEGNVSISGTMTTGANTITAAGNWAATGTFGSNGTVTFDGAAQSLSGAFNNLVLAGTSIKTATAALDVAGNFTINSGVTLNTQSFTHALGGNWSNAGSVNASSSTFMFDGSGNTQTVISGGLGATKAFNNFTVNKSSGTVILSAGNDLEVNGSLTIISGSVNANTNSINIAGNFSNAGIFTASTGTLTFDGTTGGPYTIDAGASSLNNVTVNASGRVYQLSNNLDVNGDITLLAGTLDLNGRLLDFGNAITDTIAVSSTLEIDAGATLRLFAGSSAGAGVEVKSGGTINVVGTAGNRATVTRFSGTSASDRYGFFIRPGGTIASSYALFEYMNAQGIVLESGADIDSIDNFSNTNFNNGAVDGRFLSVSDLAGTDTLLISATGFLSDPGGTSYNIDKIASDDTLTFNAAFGVFAGAANENDPGDNVGWTGAVASIQWAGGGTSAWSLGSNWIGGVAPTVTDDALIPSGNTPYPIVSGTQTARSVTVESGASLTISTGDTLHTAGTLTNGGTLTLNNTSVLQIDGDYVNSGLVNANTSEILLTGTSDQTVNTGGTGVGQTLYDLKIDKSTGTAILASNIQIDNNLSIVNGALDVSNSNFSITLGGDWDNSGTFSSRNGTITISGSSTLTTGGTGVGKDFYNLTLTSGASVVLAGNLDVNNNLTVQTGTSLDVTTSNYTINLGGNLSNSGSLFSRAGTLTLDGSSAQSIDVDAVVDSLHHLVVNKPAGTATVTAGPAAPMDVNGNLTITSGTLSTGTVALDIEGNVSITGSLTTGVSTITAAGNWNTTGTFSGTNTLTLDGGNQNISGSFNHLVMGGTSTKTATAALDINGNLSINSGVTFNAGALTHTLAGNWNNSAGTFTASTSTILFDGTGTQGLTSGGTGATKAFNNLSVNKSGGTLQLTAANDLDVNGNLIITVGTFNANTSDLFVSGNFNNGGTFLAGTGTLTFNGSSGSYSINDGSSGLGVVEVDAAGTVYQLVGTTAIKGNLTITAGTLDLNGNTLTFGDANTDALSISDSLVIDANAILRMYTGSGSGTGLTVNNGGTIIIVGSAGNRATVTRYNGTGASDRYSFTVASGATIEANYAIFEYMGTSGINLQTGSTLDATNNFSNTNFINGPGSGSYLVVDDISGSNTFAITATGFLSDGPTYNVDKTATDDTLNFDQAFGVFAGAANENDPGGIVNWTAGVVATQWTGGTSSDWGTASNWTSGVPTASDDAVIPDVSRDPIVTGTQVARNVTIQSGGLVTVATGATLDLAGSVTNTGILTLSGTAQLDVGGDFVNSGVLNANTSTITFNGPTNQTITTGGTASGKRFNDVTIDKSGGSAILAGNMDVNGDLTITTGTLDVGAANYSITVAGDWSNSATFQANSGTVTLDGTSAQSIDNGSAGSFYNLTVASSNTVSLTGNDLDVDNNLTVNFGSTFGANGQDISVGGNWLNSGTFTAASGLVTFDGTGSSYSISSNSSSFQNVGVNAGGATSYQLTDDIDINGDLNILAGKLDVVNHTLTFGDDSGDSIKVAGTLEVDANGSVQMTSGSNVVVSSGGICTFLGTSTSARAEITRQSSGNYLILVQSGGTINPAYADFNYLGGASAGIRVESGGIINATNKFDYSLFQNGTGTAYMSIANDQSLTITGIQFETGPTYNIDYSGSGALSIHDYSGALAGARYENKPGTAITWEFDQSKDVSGTTAVTFGNDLTITPSAVGQFGQIRVELVNGNLPSTPISVARYYLINPEGIGTGTAAVILTYDDDELGVTTESNLNLWRRSGASWVGPIDPDNHNTITNEFTLNSMAISRGVVDTLILSDAENDQSLPVELIAFNASTEKGVVTISWITASELENSHFLLERSENEADDYVTVARLEGQGNTATETRYEYSDEVVKVGHKYFYRLTDVDYAGNRHSSDHITVEVIAPINFRLGQNYPNPFNHTTIVQYDLPEASKIDIIIYNVLGQKVIELVNDKFDAGYYKHEWDGTNQAGLTIASGLYIIRFNARGLESDKNFTKVIKAILLK